MIGDDSSCVVTTKTFFFYSRNGKLDQIIVGRVESLLLDAPTQIKANQNAAENYNKCFCELTHNWAYYRHHDQLRGQT